MSDYVLSLNKSDKFQQFIFELKYALNELSRTELLAIFKIVTISAGKQTISKKVEAVKSVSKSVGSLISRYNRNGIINSVQNDYARAKEFTLQIPAKTQALIDMFIKLPRDKQVEQIALLILTFSIFFLSAGGSDFEGGLPDLDIAVGGIGQHRNLFSHTILLGFGIEFAARTGILLFERLKERLPDNHLPVWDKTYLFLENHKELGLAAMWTGIGVHLIKDSGFLIGGTKPYTGLPVEMSMHGHQGLFAANGIACEMFATNVNG